MKNFIVPERKVYQCGHCGEAVVGGRYNNHCPRCLWSRHMDDETPGDRASTCQGMMEPIGAFTKGDTWRIVHQCDECGKRMTVDMAEGDDFDKVVELSLSGVI